jgi:hypothetical protein
MSIEVSCPYCQTKFIVKDRLAGSHVACPDCKKLVTIPTTPRATADDDYDDDDPPPRRARGGRLRPITKKIPSDIRSELQRGETAYHFEFIPFKGGCLSPGGSDEDWLLVTDRRVLYEASIEITEGSTQIYARRSGDIPLSKVSYVETTTFNKWEGCTNIKGSLLVIASSGGRIKIPVPTEEQALRVRRAINELIASDD